MKKTLALILILALSLSMTVAATAEATGGLKLGFSVDTVTSSSKDVADTDGTAQVDSVAVAVLIDADGKIVDVDIDSAQTKMPFTAAGTLGESFPVDSKTKRELGTEYGMSAVSKIGDWDVQAAALCDYLIGKTAEEVKGIKLDEATKPVDEELAAGCTMSIGSFVPTIISAMENAVDCDAKATDKVAVGISTSTSKSKDAQDGKDGQCMAYSFFVAVAADENGVISACRIDSTQGTVTFDATGKITSDLTARTATKQELGES